jgi:hypothetical protein
MTDLSPQAQAIVDAFYCELRIDYEHVGLAAALRAAAWEILPMDSPHIEEFPEDDDDTPSDRIRYLKKRIRQEFLAIAKELENV